MGSGRGQPLRALVSMTRVADRTWQSGRSFYDFIPYRTKTRWHAEVLEIKASLERDPWRHRHDVADGRQCDG